MLLRNGIKQTFRTPVRLTAYFLVLLFVSSFLCIGLNMKRTADANLNSVVNEFNVLALPDFKAFIDEYGQLTSAGDSVGCFQTQADYNYLSNFQELPGVRTVDSRTRFGAAMEGLFYTLSHYRLGTHYESPDVVIFSLSGEEPVTIPAPKRIEGSNMYTNDHVVAFNVSLHWSAAGRSLNVNRLQVSNLRQQAYVLEPGKTYIENLSRTNRICTTGI